MSSNNVDLDKPFALLTSLRYDPELVDLENAPRGLSPAAASFASHIWLSRHHVDRLRSAAYAHAWAQAVQFDAGNFVKACQLAIDSLTRQGDLSICKIRILLDENGYFRGSAVPTSLSSPDLIAAAEFHPTTGLAPEVLGPVLHIVMDHLPTPSSIFTRTKTDHREHYDAARKRMGVPPLGVVPASSAPNDVLLYNEAGSVTETTVRNVAFFRDGRWVTPHADTGCLVGVVRRHLLHQGLVYEAGNASALLANGVQTDEIILLFNAVEGCRLGRIIIRGPHSGFDHNRLGGQDNATQ